jgi:hypothetical protein
MRQSKSVRVSNIFLILIHDLYLPSEILAIEIPWHQSPSGPSSIFDHGEILKEGVKCPRVELLCCEGGGDGRLWKTWNTGGWVEPVAQ